MDSDRPDIADFLRDMEELNASMTASGFVPLRRQSAWWSASRFWLLSLMAHAMLLALALVFGSSRPFGRGGSPEGLFFSASFSTGDVGSSGGAAGRGEIDTTIHSDAESDTAVNSPFRMTSAAAAVSGTRPLLTLTPADPEAIFNVEPTESLTAELTSMRDAPSVRPATQRRTVSEPKTAVRSKSINSQDRENIDQSLANESASTIVQTESPHNGEVNTAARQSGSRTKSQRPGRGEAHATEGDGDSGSSTGTANGNRTTFFGIGAEAKRFVYVIDASESMHEHRAMQVARDELWESLQELTESATFQVLFFNLKQQPLSRRGERPKLLAANASNLRMAQQFLNGIQPDSGTDRLAALTSALSFDPDVVFLLTDADAPELTPKDLADIRRLNRRKAVINVVEFGKLPDIGRDNFLRALARQHDGSHRYHNLVSPTEP